MRPVLLEMNGFASFREPTTVDFRGAEYFALVGPTGSGKSTIIDAITFALYGSVPRWDNARTVALALAPTAGRGAVRFVFDVGGARYVAARELRRGASGGVTVRSARLERLRRADGVGAPDEETDPLADGAPAVSRAVEELLGLPFGDFTTCVVLPQGDFAEFLHTEPRKRQEKLVRILGLGVYDTIAREANSEAAEQGQRAELLGEQLGAYADATEEVERATAARVTQLAALVETVAAAVPEHAAAEAELAEAHARVERLGSERARLGALAVPDGLTGLDARHRAAATTVSAATEALDAAEGAEGAARERLAAAPERGPLEQAARDHAELASVVAELPGAREAREKARAADEAAVHDAAQALAAVDAARAVRDAAEAALSAAKEKGAALAAERDGLRAVRIPAGLDALDGRRSAAASTLDAAQDALAEAEEADARARAALAAAPGRGPLEQAGRDHRELADTEREHATARERVATAERDVAVVAARVAEAHQVLEHARARHDEGLRTDLAAALRPGLEAGHECPVCAQQVTRLPPPLPGTDAAAGERAVTTAQAAVDDARRAEAAAVATRAAAAAEEQRLAAATARLRDAVAGFADPDAVRAALADLDVVGRAATDADTAARAARHAQQEAARAADAVRADAVAAAAQLRSARDPLVPFGAPAVDDEDVLAGWAGLVAWARGEANARDAALPAARAAYTAAQGERDTAAQAVALAERAAQERRRDETDAARAEQEARGAVERAEQRERELRAALDGAPTAAAAAEGLRRLAELEAAARAADAQVRAARAALRSAERDTAEVARELGEAWLALRSARDPLVPLGAPAVADDDLMGAWSALTRWARDEAAARAGLLDAAAGAVTAAEGARAAVERRITAQLDEHDVPAPAGAVPAAAHTAVVTALERARAAGERIAERRAAAGTIAADRAAAESAHQVAKMLGGLLRSNMFPQWLVASALDALVADASRSLADLSAGQFELTHDKGEFLVVDHADADARRPVKTLSGGETFQASLALALALSAQMSGLAARGAARLESIFLDEGFGTLDESNLDIVASTLENLATHGDRVVGVITHVPALAERVPVRFAVSRDQRTSSVVREGT